MRVRMFDDIYSLAHFLFGFIAALLGIDVSATLLYVAYQALERESIRSKLGDFVEYALGLLLGALLRAFRFSLRLCA